MNFCPFRREKITNSIKFKAPKIIKMAFLKLPDLLKIDFAKNLNDRKIQSRYVKIPKNLEMRSSRDH